jgi:hypothetical protein
MLTKTNNAPSPHAEAAKAFIEKLRALRDEIPHFTTDDFGNGRSQNGSSVPEKFMESASAAVQKSLRLEQAGGADATTLRDAYAYAIAFDPVVQEIVALGKFLAHSIRQQRVNASECALDVYSLAKRLAGRKDGAELKPFVEDMREKLGKKATRKTNSDPVPAPAPVVPAPPPKV